jgi:hypothetical protein
VRGLPLIPLGARLFPKTTSQTAAAIESALHQLNALFETRFETEAAA